MASSIALAISWAPFSVGWMPSHCMESDLGSRTNGGLSLEAYSLPHLFLLRGLLPLVPSLITTMSKLKAFVHALAFSLI